eukprot:TRINITY_DN16578_c0_g1_i4.p1 TRINITY_DN16578_c0_g1~~TRINITY_DN16578_c0_g1_i4.p1  ORF type:complete len:252 (-),score=55.91 TRINITY_DN16578_c0_g1_i4:10-765(-)
MKSKLGVRPDDAVLKQYDDSSAEVLSALAGINPALFWIPGNHDPDTMFEDPESLTIAASTLNIGTNIHGKLVQLAPSLYLAGYGGAVEASIDGQPSWGAYPVTDEELGAGILPLSEEISILPADSSVLLMTHCGPNGSSTAEVSGWDANSITAQGVREHWVLSGSRSLRDMIQSEQLQSKTLLNVHGHTHNGCGMARLGAVTVLNPGSVRYLSLIHISEPTRLLSISYAVFCLKKKKKSNIDRQHTSYLNT